MIHHDDETGASILVHTYTCRGPVRGGCGHRHKTLRTAALCCAADQRACERQGGYSDRSVVDTLGHALSDDDLAYVLDVANGGK